MNRLPRSASASRGEIQIEFDRFPPVVGERLAGRREGEEEARVEALRQEDGRDPVSEGDEPVDRRRQVLAAQKLGEGRGAVEVFHAPGRDEVVLAASMRQQRAAFLERFPDRGDLERGERVGAADERSGERGVRRLHPSARKDQRAGGETRSDDGARS